MNGVEAELRSKARWSEARSATANWLRKLIDKLEKLRSSHITCKESSYFIKKDGSPTNKAVPPIPSHLLIRERV